MKVTTYEQVQVDKSAVALGKFQGLHKGHMLLLEKINEMGTTILVVTHEKELVNAFSKRVIAIDGGHLISDGMDGYYSYEVE